MAVDTNLPKPPASAGEALRARAAEALAFNRREIAALALLALLVLTGAGIAYARGRPSAATAARPVEPSGALIQPGTTPVILFVHIVGAVRDPGVYKLKEGARVIDAVRAAGGLRRSADVMAVNMARVLADGEQIIVPRRARPADPAEPGTAPPAEAADALVNINTAGAGELETLPGIGPVLAQRIIDYREQHGPFVKPEDLMDVSGIGPKTYESIAPHVTV
jgi:competence protein ComEA